MVKIYPIDRVKTLTKEMTPQMRYTGGDFKKWQTEARAKLAELLGLDTFLKVDEDLNIEWTKETDEYEEIRFHFRSEIDYYVPCHLRIPNGAKLPVAVVICLQGHSKGMHISLGNPKFPGDEGDIKGGDRDFATRIIKEGYAALAIEQRDMGECGGTEKGPECHVPTMANLLIGRTTIGERVWDISRAIDVLEKHFPQVDSKKVMCMGNSGGGTATFYAAAMEERIIGAMPSCSVCSLDDSIGIMWHCTCNFIPNMRKYFDMCDVGGLIAPRKLVMVNGVLDTSFPIDSARRTYDFIKNLYKAADAEDSCAMVEGQSGHRFYADDSWPVFNKILG